MIIIRMAGGLGNQMFQYALYLQLCSLGREVALDDTTKYTADANVSTVSRRVPQLSVFGIEYPRASKSEIQQMTDCGRSFGNRLRRRLLGSRSRIFEDSDFIFDPSFLEREEGYYCGFFQSERYFDGVKEEVRKTFDFRKAEISSDPLLQEQKKMILDAGSASGDRSAAIHLRFGDYLNNPALYGGICTDAYYYSGVHMLKSRNSAEHFFVFSNDSKRAQEWIMRQPDPADFTLINGRDEEHGWLDLYLMHLCDDFIIANSSFSWWGAWLGTRRDRQIIAPTIWVNKQDGSALQRQDIFMPSMLRVNPAGRVYPPSEQEVNPERRIFAYSEPAPASGRPAVSVIVAAYNIESYIGRALDSLTGQTLQNLEIIAVDDGSTDHTGQICDEAAAKDPRIHVVHKENGGLSDARNAGIAQAHGEYIGYLDGDDWAEPAMYETMYKACIKADAQIALVRYRDVYENTQECGTEGSIRSAQQCGRDGNAAAGADGSPADTRDEGFVDDVLLKSVILDRQRALDVFVSTGFSDHGAKVVIYNSVWSKLFRRDIVENLHFIKGRNSEDIMYTTKALCAAGRCVYIPEEFYNYVQDRAGSIMNQKLGERRLNDEMPFWLEHIQYLKDHDAGEAAQKAEYYFYRRYMFYDMDFRRNPALKPCADRLEKWMQERSGRILQVMNTGSWSTAGDRQRMKMFLRSPARYQKWSDLYEKTIVRWKSRERT